MVIFVSELSGLFIAMYCYDDPLHIFTDLCEYVKQLLDKIREYAYSLKFSGNTCIP